MCCVCEKDFGISFLPIYEYAFDIGVFHYISGPCEDDENFQHELRGIIPRSFENLFNLVEKEKEMVIFYIPNFSHSTLENFIQMCQIIFFFI